MDESATALLEPPPVAPPTSYPEVQPLPESTSLPSCIESLLTRFLPESETPDQPPGKKIGFAIPQERLRKYFKSYFDTLPQDQKIDRRVDMYNVSLLDDCLAVRIQPRHEGSPSKVIFTTQNSEGKWQLMEDSPVFDLEDPFLQKIGDEIIFGGVKPYHYTAEGKDEVATRTIFYRGKSINELKPFAYGPTNMKDIRLVQLKDGRIGIFTRPRGGKFGNGQICFTIVNSLENFQSDTLPNPTEEKLNQLPLEDPASSEAFILANNNPLKQQFPQEDRDKGIDEEDAHYPGEWGGVNEAHLLRDGRILAFGHRAYRDIQSLRHYYPWAFILNPENGEMIDLGILATRSDFPAGVARAIDLVDVIFSGNIMSAEEGKDLEEAESWMMIIGLSDAEAGIIKIANPFKRIKTQNKVLESIPEAQPLAAAA